MQRKREGRLGLGWPGPLFLQKSLKQQVRPSLQESHLLVHGTQSGLQGLNGAGTEPAEGVALSRSSLCGGFNHQVDSFFLGALILDFSNTAAAKACTTLGPFQPPPQKKSNSPPLRFRRRSVSSSVVVMVGERHNSSSLEQQTLLFRSDFHPPHHLLKHCNSSGAAAVCCSFISPSNPWIASAAEPRPSGGYISSRINCYVLSFQRWRP